MQCQNLIPIAVKSEIEGRKIMEPIQVTFQ